MKDSPTTILGILSFLALLINGTLAHSILDFGAIADNDSLWAEQTNSNAFNEALIAANFTEPTADRKVIVPAGMTFHTMPIYAENLVNITIQIDGTIKFSKRHNKWPLRKEDTNRDCFALTDVNGIKIEGSGTVDGQGYMWWVREWLGLNHHKRPILLNVLRGRNIEITGVRWLNSPRFNIWLEDIDTAWVHDFEIYVDVKGQLELGKLLFGSSSENGGNGGFIQSLNNMTLPMFPLNTDGVDPHGRNILIERLNITNYDDAIAIKPSHSHYQIANCTENVVVRDMNIWFGVGLSVGSVPANDKYNCVNNVTFSNARFYHPFKAIYIKTNPGHTTSMLPGSGGVISNILYENLTVYRPIWWTIYIGPQQQNQPGRDSDPGCLLYPLVPCETQPLIDVKNITLRNVDTYGAVLPPGIIRCNETNPCTGINFENVKVRGWWRLLNKAYITENVFGEVRDSKPVPQFSSENAGISAATEDEFIGRVFRQAIQMFFSGNNQATRVLKNALNGFNAIYKTLAF